MHRLILALILLSTALLSAQEPLPFLRRQDVILFQGDSITDGGRQRAGMDYNHIMGQDYAYILAAQIGLDSPQRELYFVNRGAGGDWVSDLEARWQTDTLDLHPALLSILIGVNDTLSTRKPSQSAEQFETVYDRLLAQTIKALPTTRIVLGEPFVLPVGKHKLTWESDRAEIVNRQQVVARLAAKYNLPLVHLSTGLRRCMQARARRTLELGRHSPDLCRSRLDGPSLAANSG